MTSNDNISIDYYVGVLPKGPHLDPTMVQILAQKLCDLRISILLEAEKALSRSSLQSEMERDEKTYRDEIEDPLQHCVICCQYRSGMQGNVFANAGTDATKIPSLHQAPNEHDKEIMQKGHWVGVVYAFGPLSMSDWVLPSFKSRNLGVEERYHFSSLYIQRIHRQISPRPGTTLLNAMADVLSAHLVAQVRSIHSSSPVYLRRRLTVSPENVEQSNLIKRYQTSWGYTITGWIPKAAALLANRTRVDEWPKPEQDHDLYSRCNWAVMECLERVDQESVMAVTANDASSIQPRL